MTIDRTFSIDLPEGMLTGSVTCEADEPTPNATAALGDALNMALLVTCLRLNASIKASETLVRSAAEAITEADTHDVSATFTSLLVQAHGASYQLQLTLSISTILSEAELEHLLSHLYATPFQGAVRADHNAAGSPWGGLGFGGVSLWQTLLGFRPPGAVSLMRSKSVGRADLSGAGYGFLSDRRLYGDPFGRRIISDETHHATGDLEPLGWYRGHPYETGSPGPDDVTLHRYRGRPQSGDEPPRGGTRLTIGDAVASGLIPRLTLPTDQQPGYPGTLPIDPTGDDDPESPDEPPSSPDPAA